jgi:hypothetical protein
MKQATTLKQAIDKVVDRMSGVMSRKEIVEAVLKRYPSKAKDPASSIMSDLRWRKEIVALGNARYARADDVLDGARFRIKVSGEDISLGKLAPARFNPFEQVLPPIESIFVSSDGEVIPVVTKALDVSSLTDEQLKSMLVSLGESLLRDPLAALALPAFGASEEDEDSEEEDDSEEEFDEEEMLNQVREMLKDKLAQEVKMHDFSGFYQKHEVREGDSLIVTMKPKEKTYLFEHEPASKAQEHLIKERDQELSQFIHKAIKRSERESAREIIFRAYGNLAWLKEYPSSHWLEIVEEDDELRLIRLFGNDLEIASIDYRMMFDMLGVDEATERKLRKRRTGIEQEVDDFLDRFDDAYEAATERLVGDFDEGGPENVVTRTRRLRDEEKLAEHNDQLRERFFEAEKKRSGDETAAGRKAGDVSLLADFLSGYQGQTLEAATLDDLDEFLFDWYPRKVLDSSSAHAKQLAASMRDFYRFLVEANVIRSARFAEAIFKLRDLAGEKVELYHRLPTEDPEGLFARLFGGW